nr:glycosyl hydrolase lipoprotein [Bacilli bacterium]
MLRKGMIFIILVSIVSMSFFGIRFMENKETIDMKEELAAEQFIKKHLYEENGLIKTDLKGQSNVYLAETTGLWMEYLVKKDDYLEFKKQAKVLKLFKEDSQLISWKIDRNRKAPANALIDDLRIIQALEEASDRWGIPKYRKMARQMGKDIVRYNMENDYFIDHADIKTKHKADFITLSYLNPKAIHFFLEEELIDESQYLLNREVLVNAPVSKNGFFPITYYPSRNEYEFEREVNLINQYYIGYYRALWGGDVSSLIRFTKESLEKYGGVLYGRFSSETKEPAVEYEGASVYALAILMCLQAGEDDLARQLFYKMKELQVLDASTEYYGGYINLDSLETHTFDNLLPLIAEREAIDEGVFY